MTELASNLKLMVLQVILMPTQDYHPSLKWEV